MFNKVLIANRGDIAIRVIQACQELGCKAVSVYSDADRTAPHVRASDEAVRIGEAPADRSYLDIERIIRACKETGAEALHPGYGFLAENADLARRCQEEGITFIGPTPGVIELMGNKIKAKRTMEDAGVPVIPGYNGEDQSIEALEKEGVKIGFPLMIKATLGGGGKGMRIVTDREKLGTSLEAARREALSSFGSEHLFLERYIDRPRHIEFQILADGTGNVVHLFERECSIQRRHQKVIEETPSMAIDPVLRERMGTTAVKAARAVNYTNAGTVEFMLDGSGKFYFLEMNTRIQVEHAITEAVTGVDIVKWQIRLAAREKLTLEQEKLTQRGHAIECRIYAEDPESGFLPSTGKIRSLRPPIGANIRNDLGIEEGQMITSDYDPMLSKITVLAEARDEAIEKMTWALDNYMIMGVTTNISFLKDVIQQPSFKKGEITTDFIDRYMGNWSMCGHEIPAEVLIAAAIYDHIHVTSNGTDADMPAGNQNSPWKQAGKWRLGGEQ